MLSYLPVIISSSLSVRWERNSKDAKQQEIVCIPPA